MNEILLFICIAFAQIGFGQTGSLEIWIGSMNSANIAGPKQSTETENLKATASGDNSGITVAGAFGDQQYTGIVIGSQPAINGLEFGIKDNSLSGTKSWQEDAVGVRFNSVGTPSSSYFTSPTGTADGISTFSNGAFNISTNVPEALRNGTDSGDGLYYAGTITYTFNKPVDNPILHVTGLGAIFDAPELGTTLVWHTQYEATGGLTFTKLSGTTHTLLDNGDTKIYNDWTTGEYESTGKYGTDADYAGTGSFRVNGENITSFTMKVYAKGTRAGEKWNVTGNTATKVFNNDRHTQSWTVETFDFGGIVVVDDVEDNSTKEEVVSTTASIPTTQLRAVLVDGQGKVAQVQTVNTDGTFNFSDVLGDDYKVVITTSAPAVGDSAPAASLPEGWYNQEEGFDPNSPNSSDGNANGVTNASLVSFATASQIQSQDLIIGITQVEKTPTPIEWSYFAAEAEGVNGVLDWGTASENNNSHFEVERSDDGSRWSYVGSVAGNGTVESDRDYSYVDAGIGLEKKVVYYRLKQVDHDGSIDYSAVREVRFSTSKGLSIYPSLTRGEVYIENSCDECKVNVYNQLGQLVKRKELSGASRLDLSDLSLGSYRVQIIGKSGLIRLNEKIVKID